jgi:hypothetical protein
MQKPKTHFEQVPLEIVKKILGEDLQQPVVMPAGQGEVALGKKLEEKILTPPGVNR